MKKKSNMLRRSAKYFNKIGAAVLGVFAVTLLVTVAFDPAAAGAALAVAPLAAMPVALAEKWRKAKDVLVAKNKEIDDLLNSVDDEEGITDAQQTQYDALVAERDKLQAAFDRIEAQRDQARDDDTPPQARSLPPVDHEVQGELSTEQRRDLAGFSYCDFALSIIDGMSGRQMGGINAEMAQEGNKEAGELGIAAQGTMLPAMALRYGGVPVAMQQPRNDMSVTVAPNQGSDLVPTELGGLIDFLREKLAIQQMGATVFAGLTSNLDLPKIVRDVDPTEKSETGAADEVTPTTGLIQLRPNRLPVFVEVTRQLLIQSSPDIEAWLRNYLAFTIATRMDKQALNGNGVAPNPEGIMGAAGTGGVATAGAITRDHIVDLITDVATADAEMGNLGFLTNPNVRGTLMKTKVDAGSGRHLLESRSDDLLGFNVGYSTNVPGAAGAADNALLYGNWSDMILAQWGGLDFLANPYSRDTEGIIRLNAGIFYDVGVRHPESFSIADDVNG